MPKYLKAVAMTTEKSTAEHTLMWLILPKYINCHYFLTKSETMCETLLWEVAAYLREFEGPTYPTHFSCKISIL